MQCRDYRCRKGEVNTGEKVMLQTGCNSAAPAHPCTVCGRLHWPNGDPVHNRSGHRAFFQEGRVININRRGRIVIIY